MSPRPRLKLAVAVLFGLLLAGDGRATPLVADLSDYLVAITTGFSGTNVLLFGAIDEPGDVVVVVRGSDRPVVSNKSAGDDHRNDCGGVR